MRSEKEPDVASLKEKNSRSRKLQITMSWIVVMIMIITISGLIYFAFIRFSPDSWETEILEAGFASSVRSVDLTGDGIQDLVVGGGGAEFTPTKNGVTALNGVDGTVLWSVASRNQMVGSAIFRDINSDNIPDVFIGGRSAVLLAINGADGNLIWEYLPDFEEMDLINDTTLLNFFTPQWIPDQDRDNLEDLLLAFGGFIKAGPYDTNRPAGKLFVISSRTGKALTTFRMPDGAETYMSPLVHDFAGDGQLTVIFGSGGETLNGHLYKIALQDLFHNQLSQVKILASGKGKGFIATPVLADVNLDGMKDIVANPVNGDMICIDGKTDSVLWELDVDPLFEVYTCPAPGFFTRNDTVPDFFSSMGSGRWPDTKFTLHVLVDGKNGEYLFSDTLGLFQYASPVIFDFNKDGSDDVLLAINERKKVLEISQYDRFYINALKVVDVFGNEIYNLGIDKFGSNLGSTPLITDLDGDRFLDVIYCYMDDPEDFYSFRKGKIVRTELNIKVKNEIRWGEYLGSGHDGIF